MKDIPQELAWKLYEAAKDMPTETPAAGGSSTIHPFEIEAGIVWELGKVIKKIDAFQEKIG